MDNDEVVKDPRFLSIAEELLVPSILGSISVIHRVLFLKVSFDPIVPRGEDIDYQINAAISGFHILFDKDQGIHRLHPERGEVFLLGELRGDIQRFLPEDVPGRYRRFQVFGDCSFLQNGGMSDSRGS